MNKFSNKKKIILGSIIGVLIGTLVSVSYAFFTFQKTGNNSQLVAGDIYMKYKESSNTININNMSPRSDKPTNDYFEFTVEGKNTYTEKPIVYDINILYGNDITGKERIGDEWLRFTLEEKKDGASEFTEVISNASYVGFENALRIWKETIPANTTNDIVNTYRLYVWIDNSVGIGNTTEADYSIQRWNNLFASIKVNVTGDFEEKELSKNLYDVVKTGAQSDEGMNLYEKVGVGNFLRNTTKDDPYPVYYYRGAVENNNAIFANKCWKIVRTTDTGGTKLIYNGELKKQYGKGINQNDYTIVTKTGGWTFDVTDNSWNVNIINGDGAEISFKMPSGSDYMLEMTGTTGSTTGGSYFFYKDDNQVYTNGGGGGQPLSYDYLIGTLTNDNVIKMKYQGSGTTESPVTFKLIVWNSTSEVLGQDCNNTGSSSQLPETSVWNPSYKSPAYVGYNYGDVYEWNNQSKSGTYGNGVSWDGSKYTLTNTSSSPDAYHHYICDDTNTTTCTKVRYYFYTGYYIVLQNGDTIETALKKMLSESSDVNPSPIKGVINTWYNTNIKNSYGKFVEDTKWCNDRSVSSTNLGGWNPNGGSLLEYMYFDVGKRVENASSSNQPVLTCSNANDIMTFKNGKLDNSVALLTYDEAALAGVQRNSSNSSSYLITGSWYWLLSPSDFSRDDAYVGDVSSTNSSRNDVSNTGGGVRPSLSLKPGTQVFGGTGTVSDPYIVGTAN